MVVRGLRAYRPVRVEGSERRVRTVLQRLERRWPEGGLSEIQAQGRARLGTSLRGDARGAVPANPEHGPRPPKGDVHGASLRGPWTAGPAPRRALARRTRGRAR